MLYAAVLTCVACRKEATPPPAQQTQTATTSVAEPPKDLSDEKMNVKLSVDTKAAWDCMVGSSLAAGIVTDRKTEFTPTDKVYLTMYLREAPPKLAVRAVALNEAGDEVATQQKPAEGLKSVTLELGSLKKRGKYSIRGYWGGNEACERPIEVK